MTIITTVNHHQHRVSEGEKVDPSEVVVDKDDETLVLVFEAALGVEDGVLEIKFSGVLNEHMKGFYKGYNLYLELCKYKFLDVRFVAYLSVYWHDLRFASTNGKMDCMLQIYFIEIIVRLRKGRRWWLMIMDLFLRRLSLATTTVCEEFSDVSHQSPERFVTALITKMSPEAFTQLLRMGAREEEEKECLGKIDGGSKITGCSGRVKDYVMECIRSEIKQRPKSEWITADASSSAV
ncbi:aminopeptidase M1-like protein isoform X1 [Tanacetum coccineum]